MQSCSGHGTRLAACERESSTSVLIHWRTSSITSASSSFGRPAPQVVLRAHDAELQLDGTPIADAPAVAEHVQLLIGEWRQYATHGTFRFLARTEARSVARPVRAECPVAQDCDVTTADRALGATNMGRAQTDTPSVRLAARMSRDPGVGG